MRITIPKCWQSIKNGNYSSQLILAYKKCQPIFSDYGYIQKNQEMGLIYTLFLEIILMNFLFLLFLPFHLEQCFGEENVMDQVEKAIDKFATITSNGPDVLSHVNIASRGLFGFLKLALPVGSLILGSKSIAGQVESEEYKALMRMERTMKNEFERINQVLRHSKRVVNLGDQLKDYIIRVRVPRHQQREQLELFWDPAINKTDRDEKEFKRICLRESTDPRKILDYLHTLIYDECSDLEETDMEDFVQIRSLLTTIFNQIEPKPEAYTAEMFWQTASYIQSQLISMDRNSRTLLLEKINTTFIRPNKTTKREYVDLRKVARQMKSVVEGFSPTYFENCLLRAVIVGRNFDREALYHFYNILRMDISLNAMFASQCANVSMDGDPDDMARYVSRFDNRAKRVYSFARSWIAQNLEMSWPMAEKDTASQVVVRMNLPEPILGSHKFERIATNITNELALMGTKKYVHQVLVSTNKVIDKDFYAICPVRWCFFIQDYHTLNIMVARFDSNDQPRIWEAYQALSNHSQIIYDTFYNNYNIEKVSDLYGKIENATKIKLVNVDTYSSAVLIRDTTSGAGDCGISELMHVREHDIDNMAWATFQQGYRYAGSITRWCESYMLILFA